MCKNYKHRTESRDKNHLLSAFCGREASCLLLDMCGSCFSQELVLTTFDPLAMILHHSQHVNPHPNSQVVGQTIKHGHSSTVYSQQRCLPTLPVLATRVFGPCEQIPPFLCIFGVWSANSSKIKRLEQIEQVQIICFIYHKMTKKLRFTSLDTIVSLICKRRNFNFLVKNSNNFQLAKQKQE